jgi:tRNA threonylcarbamoyladenosine biosynthesis protein TsaE
MNIRISSVTDLNKVVDTLLAFANGEQKFLLVAEMGSGKTTFVKAFCKFMGVEGETSSPTFSLVNEYQYEKGLIRHLDLYRLKKLDEAIDLGIEDFFYDTNYLFIEWPEILEPILPEGMILIKINVNENKERVFQFEKI